jgi:hypothetical protein
MLYGFRKVCHPAMNNLTPVELIVTRFQFNVATRMGTTGFGYATLHASHIILHVVQVLIAQTRLFLVRGKKKRRVSLARDMARRSLSGYNIS